MSFDQMKTSRFLSLVLRHEPARAGVALDAAGWVGVAELLRGCVAARNPLTREQLEMLVRSSDKQRFAISDDGLRIRANQGHSVEVELGYTPQVPPAFLFHGTATRFVDAIRLEGLTKQARHHVHLSADEKTAKAVGGRHGKPAVLTIKAGEMSRAGQAFFVSANGVWLVEHVPAAFIDFPT